MGHVLKRMVQDNEGRRLEELCRRAERLETFRLSWTLCGVRHKPQQVQVGCDLKYEWKMVYIRRILSHAEYDRKEWQEG